LSNKFQCQNEVQKLGTITIKSKTTQTAGE